MTENELFARIKIPCEVSNETVVDLLTTFFSSVSSWAVSCGLKPPSAEEKLYSKEGVYTPAFISHSMSSSGGVFIKDRNDQGTKEVLNRESIVTGLSLLGQQYHERFARVVSGNCIPSDVDVFMQLAVFSAVVYEVEDHEI